ncbi:hypothetical protein EGI32_01340 [Ferruginibacter sp. HRS2-29]|nr:hypothetical protein [Ferruginibacter sp. HRS2-29]
MIFPIIFTSHRESGGFLFDNQIVLHPAMIWLPAPSYNTSTTHRTYGTNERFLCRKQDVYLAERQFEKRKTGICVIFFRINRCRNLNVYCKHRPLQRKIFSFLTGINNRFSR